MTKVKLVWNAWCRWVTTATAFYVMIAMCFALAGTAGYCCHRYQQEHKVVLEQNLRLLAHPWSGR